MTKVRLIIGQILAYTFFMSFIAYFSSSPEWAHTNPEDAMVKVSIRHPGKILGQCRDLSVAEIKNLSPNMKVPQQCPRERSPVRLRIELNDEVLFEESARPSGLQKDGVSTFYARFDIPAGNHFIKALLRDDANNPDQGYRLEKHIEVKPRQVLVIDFKDGFIFK